MVITVISKRLIFTTPAVTDCDVELLKTQMNSNLMTESYRDMNNLVML